MVLQLARQAVLSSYPTAPRTTPADLSERTTNTDDDNTLTIELNQRFLQDSVGEIKYQVSLRL